MKNTEKYYNDCAFQYDDFYVNKERHNDYRKIKQKITKEIKDKSILELACGTGYWTSFFLKFSTTVTSIDKSINMLNIAKNKINNNNVLFINDDVYSLNNIENNKYEVIISVFLYSHITLQNRDVFFKTMHSKIKNNGTIILIDNLHIKGSSFPINKTDKYGNRFQKRKLLNNSYYMVLKNLLNKQDFFKKNNYSIEYEEFDYCWYVKYKYKKDDYE